MLLFSGDAGPNPIDNGRSVGRSHSRIDGPLKVTGRARYASDYRAVAPGAAIGFILEAGIGRGRIARIDTTVAERAPGVVLVLTHRNAPVQGNRKDGAFPELKDDRILDHGQPVAFVVAETFEQARDAASLIRITYDEEPGRFDPEHGRAAARLSIGTVLPPVRQDTAIGNLEAAMASAAVTIDRTYTTPPITHAMMEPYAALARWDDRTGLTLWTSHQLFEWAYRDLPRTLLLPPEKIRIVAAFVGGGFGGKLYFQAEAILSALAARMLRRPVRTAMTRPQMMNMTRHSPQTIQRLQLGADRQGHLTAIGHDVWHTNPDWGGEQEMAANQTRLLYAGANRRTTHRHIVVDWPKGSAIRAPGERTGMMALEVAMDELAEATGIDPVELRIRNDVAHDPEAGPSLPFASRSLIRCLREGATRFGWSQRSDRPAQIHDGRWMVGMGMASAFRRNQVKPSGARVTMSPAGHVLVESGATDIGTGTYTIMAQTAAEMLGVPIANVTVRLGDSLLPEGAGGGGSWGANSATSGLYVACQAMRRRLARNAGFDPASVDFKDGRLVDGARSVGLPDAIGQQPLITTGRIEFAKKQRPEASFGSHFCEVGVDRYTGEIRMRRWLSVVDIGRVLNPLTARSQMIGGVTFGIGAALMEEAVMDHRHGLFINHDLAGYHVPVHADVGEFDIVFLDALEPSSSPMKAKGVGELGNCGSSAAVANAVFNACGVRVRNYPITPDKLIDSLLDR
ncbi:xanthine dehydrogenase family protein molybdopterin-binding subunit [Sphingomonas prati]|uniref:xanthine dehydrogenase family protein molybdopterin-binding subunit n=1 Tax=Sphingomonas prati TaxID=1843237 RepID=UPI0012F67008|nr:xanthine dehydrogenase family protein molybdopterin-binding subunit [Sphingomonas prati]